MNKLIIGLMIGLIVGGVIGYFAYGMINKPNPDFMREENFQMNEDTKNEIVSFFDSNPGESEIENYCQENPMNCRYYCMEINPDHKICSQTQIMGGRFRE